MKLSKCCNAPAIKSIRPHSMGKYGLQCSHFREWLGKSTVYESTNPTPPTSTDDIPGELYKLPEMIETGYTTGESAPPASTEADLSSVFGNYGVVGENNRTLTDYIARLIQQAEERGELRGRSDELENRLRVQFTKNHWEQLRNETNSWAKYVDRRIAELKAQLQAQLTI